MPPDMARRRPSGADVHTAAADNDSTTSNTAMTFAWRQCDRHPWYGVSVIVTAEASPGCIGLPNAIRGHWSEPGTNR